MRDDTDYNDSGMSQKVLLGHQLALDRFLNKQLIGNKCQRQPRLGRPAMCVHFCQLLRRIFLGGEKADMSQ